MVPRQWPRVEVPTLECVRAPDKEVQESVWRGTEGGYGAGEDRDCLIKILPFYFVYFVIVNEKSIALFIIYG